MRVGYPSLNHLVILGRLVGWQECGPNRVYKAECTIEVPRSDKPPLVFRCGLPQKEDLAALVGQWFLLSGKAKSNGYVQARTFTCIGDPSKYAPPGIHHISALGKVGETIEDEYDLVIYREYGSEGPGDTEAVLRCKKRGHSYQTDMWATVQGAFYPDGAVWVRSSQSFEIKIEEQQRAAGW